VCDALARVQGHADGRADGQRARDRAEPRGGPGRPGAEFAAAQGRGSRSERRPRDGSFGRQGPGGEEVLMTTVPVLDVSGKKVGDRELPDEIFDAKVSVPLMHQVVVA